MVSLPRSTIANAFTSSHHHSHRQHLRLFFGAAVFWSAFVVPALAQVGLRTSPLTAPKNKSNQGLISKWTEMIHRQKSNDSLIDYKLGAIFRGVAYGVSTISPSSNEMEEEKEAVKSEEHHGGHKHHKVPDVVAHMPDVSVVSTSSEDSTSNNAKRINTMLERERHHIDYTRHSEYEDDLPVTQSSASHINVQESVGRSDGDSRIYGSVSKDHMIDLTSERPEDNFATRDVIRQSVGPWGEPTPDWILARQVWGVAWEVHVYTVAALYSLLAIFALYCLARIHASTHLLPRGYYVTILLLLFLAAFFRSVYLFHDPYSCEGKLPAPLSYVLINTGAPCLVGALAVLILALLRATRTHLLPPRLQTPLALSTIVAFHLGLSIAADVVVGVMGARAAPLHVVVQAVTAIWGAALCVGYVWVFSHVERAAVRQQGELVRMTFTRVHLEGGTVPRRLPRPSLSRGARLTLAATVTGLLLVGLQAYGMMALQGLWAHHKPQPWPWYGYQSASRLLEILMWILIGVASALPAGNSQGKQRSKGSSGGSSTGSGKEDTRLLSMFCRSCAGSSEKSWNGNVSGKKQVDDMYPTICQTNQAVRQFAMQTGTKVIYEDASTTRRAFPQRRVNTGVMPANKKRAVRKSATLHSATSDIHLLWNQGGGVPSNASSRPSSMLFNESGFVRFRTQVDPQQNMEEVLRKSSQNLDKLCDDTESPKKTPTQKPKEKDLVHERNRQNSAHRSLKKSQKNQHNINRYDDPYESGQFEHLLQNRINSELYSNTKKDSTASCQSEVSATDYSSTDVLSPNNDPDWSKYASTCSSISAANSFDVRMYDDFEVASYYHHPSSVSTTGSSNLYSSLHKLSGPRAKLLRQHAVYAEEVAGVHKYEDPAMARHTMEQLTALLAPQTCAVSVSSQSDLNVDYLTDVSASHDGFQENASPSLQGSDSDACSNASHHYDEGADDERSVTASPVMATVPQSPPMVPVLQPGTPSRRPLHLPLHHDITPDSAVVVDYSGHTEGEDFHSGGEDVGVNDLNMLKISSSSLNDVIKAQSRAGLLSKLVGSNFSIHGHGYSPLSSEDAAVLRQEGNRTAAEKSAQCELTEKQKRNTSPLVRPCGHRPRRRQGRSQNSSRHHSPRQQQSSSTSSTATGPPVSCNSPVKPSSATSIHSSASHTTLSMSDGATQTESRVWASQSPGSSRPNSSLASHSDLPSECVDSEDSNNPGDTHNSSTDIEDVKRSHRGGRSRYTRAREETGV
ncbi:uncharacterized protein LOC143034604 [Oratosquilla oratoria]|uniref:uncharacterized protein LOC143034604 n=1 Tax=Oratosquilla oratoria TaxID=337810 RepID=UPI003F758C69